MQNLMVDPVTPRENGRFKLQVQHAWPLSLVVLSMGGKIALALAAEIPERVELVVTVALVPPQGLAFDAKAWMLYRAALEGDVALASLIGLLARRRYP